MVLKAEKSNGDRVKKKYYVNTKRKYIPIFVKSLITWSDYYHLTYFRSTVN